MQATIPELLALSWLPADQRRSVFKQSSFAAARRLIADFVTEVRPRQIQLTESWLAGHSKRRIMHWFEADFPERLRTIKRPPLVLFLAGNAELLERPQLAIVGSRKASAVAQTNADYFAEQLTLAGLLTSSGLAQGVDKHAHQGALRNGPTLAVLGNGPDVASPKRNQQLQQQIEQAGLLVTEYPPGTPSKTEHFPLRNRILSGLAKGVLVIEAQPRSGSLNTARHALEQGRSVMALPGSIWDAQVSGNLQLLRQGATLVRDANDVLQELNLEPCYQQGSLLDENKSAGSLANQQLLANVGYEATSLDTIVARSGLPVAVVSEQLVLLELEGRVASIAGGFIKVGRR